MAHYSRSYDSTYDPPMPVFDVVVQDIITGARSGQIKAIVDSGADTCLAPIDLLRTLNLRPIRRAKMHGVSGIGLSVEVFLATLEIGPIAVKGIRIVGDPHGNEFIIGRDTLNQVVVTLNGLAAVVEVSD